MQKQIDKVNYTLRGMGDEVFESIHRLMHLFRSEQYKVLRDAPYDLTHMENKALGFFEYRPGATLSDLATDSGRDKAQLARLIKSLREKGLLEAHTDSTDKRSIRLKTTEEGHKTHEAIQQQGRHLSGVAIKGLTGEECHTLLTLLRRVKENLESEPG